jgi:serine phosphatase RsbU (regulator of sigma subunit)/anti-sigma regulatory factor (Ser/Thr protein kinase)
MAAVVSADAASVQDPFAGGGAMGRLMAEKDWASTSLGPVQDWPQSLRTTVNLCLSSRAPMMVVWGPEHVQLYNDALAPLMGPKHPAALGRPYAESFEEIWDELMRPLLAGIHERGESSYVEDQPVSFHRRVSNEEMFWTFSWSPLRDENGAITGALHPAVETTERVLAERRLRLLRDLATSASQSAGVEEVCGRTVDVLAAYRLDTPLSAVYLLDDSPAGLGVPATARLVASSGADHVAAVFPNEVDLTRSTFTAWPLAAAAASHRSEVTTTLDVDPGDLSDWSWPELPGTGAVLPLMRPERSHPVGLLAIGLNPRRPLDEAQLSFLQLLAGQLAAAVTTAALHEQQHRVALTLQRSMLPDTSRSEVGLDVAARYLPGSSDVEVGGDWYDVVPLGAGRTALVIGDVMGRGVHAAAVMGQVRTAVRAYAQMDLPPERVLELLDRVVEHLSEARDIGQIVTCVYAVHDSGDETLTLASAGHPPGVLLHDRQCTLWCGPVGPPLGTGAGQYQASSRAFGGGAGLLLYTDGLVEERHADIDTGLERLTEALASAGTHDLERLADAALSVQKGRQNDDVAVLAVRVPHADLPLALVVDLRNDVRAARTARRAAAEALASWDVGDDIAEAAQLLVSELVNNAITHTGRPRQLRLRRIADRLIIEVSDADARSPRRLENDATSEGGRGLLILAGLSTDWGVRADGFGKVVWCELVLDTA